MSKRLIIPLLLISIVLVISGCIGTGDLKQFVKQLPEVQKFLSEHPNAEITAVLWSKDYIENNMEKIQEECLPAIEKNKNYYKVDIKENENEMTIWMSDDEKKVVCVYKKASWEQAKEKICTPHIKRCSGNELQQCLSDGTGWDIIEKCIYGCNSSTLACNSGPKCEYSQISVENVYIKPGNQTTGAIVAFIKNTGYADLYIEYVVLENNIGRKFTASEVPKATVFVIDKLKVGETIPVVFNTIPGDFHVSIPSCPQDFSKITIKSISCPDEYIFDGVPKCVDDLSEVLDDSCIGFEYFTYKTHNLYSNGDFVLNIANGNKTVTKINKLIFGLISQVPGPILIWNISAPSYSAHMREYLAHTGEILPGDEVQIYAKGAPNLPGGTLYMYYVKILGTDNIDDDAICTGIVPRVIVGNCIINTLYVIDSATFDSSTNNLTLVLKNLGSFELYGFTVQVLNETDVSIYNSSDSRFRISPNITKNNPLKEQRSAVIIIDMSGDYDSNLGKTANEIRVMNKACPASSAARTPQLITGNCITNTNYRIDSATFRSSTNNLTLVITNLGSVELYGFSVQVLNGTNVEVYNSTDPKLSISPNITETNPLKEQRSAVIIINMAGGYHSSLGNTADQIKVLNKACPAFSAEMDISY